MHGFCRCRTHGVRGRRAAFARDLARGAAIPVGRKEAEEEEEALPAPPPLVLSLLRRLLSADASPPVCLLHASPPVYLLFASWLSRRPWCRATSASRLCLNLFFAIWLSQLARPHLSHRRRLSSSSRLCLAMRHLRISTRCRLTTGCVVAVADAQTSLPSMRRRLCRHRNCECHPW
jgi:hypothetical protein